MAEATLTESLNALRQSHDNLAKIAEHCRQITQSQGNKQQALHETKQYALQALSSVAYQVNVAAKGINDIILEQEGDLSFLSGELSAIGQSIATSQEYVSRSKVNSLPAPEPKQDSPKVLKLPQPQFSIADRTGFKIDYRSLDNVGIGQREFTSAPFSPSPTALASAPPSHPAAPSEVDNRKSKLASNEVLSFKSRPTAPPPRAPAAPMVPQAPKAPMIPSLPEPDATPPPPPPAAAVPPPPPSFSDVPPPPPPSFSDVPPPPPPSFAEVPPPPPPAAEVEDVPPPPAHTASGGFVRALYDYVSESPEELSITAGEMLVVVNRDAGSGWMEGKNTAGMVGLFPISYVEDI